MKRIIPWLPVIGILILIGYEVFDYAHDKIWEFPNPEFWRTDAAFFLSSVYQGIMLSLFCLYLVS